VKILLQINSSLNSDQGQSSMMASRYAQQWLKSNPDGRVVKRDLAAEPISHLDADGFSAFTTTPENRTAEQSAYAAASNALINELKSADAIVIGLPMYNFGVPSTLKAWIDQVARAGKTFQYTSDGPKGLLQDRPVIVFTTRGGFYKNTPMDTQTAYITQFLNFIGIQDIQMVYAEGLAMGDEERQTAIGNANKIIDRIAA